MIELSWTAPDRSEYPLLTMKERFILDVLNDWIDIKTIKTLLPEFQYIRIKWDTSCIYKTLTILRRKGIVEATNIHSEKAYGGRRLIAPDKQACYYRIKDKWRHLL